ncbi:MAG TPA: hypothetical protein VMA75_01910 [Candidatus Paceibacterota bacterium]|nr:hypothetical protein [Candidatus Paceibacterota bacterium]
MRPFPKSVLEQYPKEFSVFKKLRTPGDVQDLLNALKMNFETTHERCRSPLLVLRDGKAHCMEGALLGAAALWNQGHPPLLLDLKTADPDVDHVIALFKDGDRWGAVSKTNHAVLRYRDPIFMNVRELVMSYFNEYFLDSGVKTLRSYSAVPFSMLRYGVKWLTTEDDLDDAVVALDHARHTPIFKKGAERRLRRAEPVEIKAGKIVEWKV